MTQNHEPEVVVKFRSNTQGGPTYGLGDLHRRIWRVLVTPRVLGYPAGV